MIKANELRIGNMYLNLKGEVSKWEFSRDDWGYYSPEEYDRLNGVPITEECLLNWGFEKEKELKFVKKVAADGSFNIVAITKNNVKDWGIIIRTFNEPVHLPIYRHVHQLQNLYFALTGEELIAK